MRQSLILTTKIWKSGNHYVAYAPELEVASQGKTREQAETRIKEAVSLFLETAKKLGTLQNILEEAGFSIKHQRLQLPTISFTALEVSV